MVYTHVLHGRRRIQRGDGSRFGRREVVPVPCITSSPCRTPVLPPGVSGFGKGIHSCDFFEFQPTGLIFLLPCFRLSALAALQFDFTTNCVARYRTEMNQIKMLFLEH